MRTQTRYSQLFALLKKHGLDKDEVLHEFTQGKKTSLTQLSDGELKQLTLQIIRAYGNTPPPGDAMRKKMGAIALQMRWVIKRPPLYKPVLDSKRLDMWCIKYGKYKKNLIDHTPDELAVLVSIFDEVLKTYLTGLNK
jgi:hypothetical protein